MASQLNIFIENRPGRVRRLTGLLAEAGIDIRSFIIQDRGDCGVVKLLVDRPARALAVLREHGVAVADTPVLAVAIEDCPGGLDRLARTLDESGVNMLDAHAFVTEPGRRAICCIEVEADQLAPVESQLREAGYPCLSEQAWQAAPAKEP